MTATEVLLLDVSERIATITLNRPEARNALSGELLRELSSAIEQCELRDDVDVVILTGADPAFCAGLDLKHLSMRDGQGGLRLRAEASSDAGAPPVVSDRRGPFPRLNKPLIGAINGPAVTGGLELALACDFLVASERARFADTHGRVGIQPSWGLTVLLPQAIGIRRAREMSMTGNFVDAGTALAWGLVNHIVQHEQLMGRARSLAADISGNDGPSIRRLLATYREGSLVTAAEAWSVEAGAAQEWLRAGHGRPEDIAQRREGITGRGRSQIS